MFDSPANLHVGLHVTHYFDGIERQICVEQLKENMVFGNYMNNSSQYFGLRCLQSGNEGK